MLTLSGVVAGYGGGNVLQGVDLHCADRTVTCIVGPNGAGKSTVLKVISGLLRCAGGSIEMGGRRTDGLAPDEILKLGITQVPQSQALFPQMSVRENVLLGGFLIRRDRKLLAERYDAVRERIPIVAERAGDTAGNLSGGQRRMVEVARCLMLAPKLLLLDEPSLGLAPLLVREIFDIIRKIHDEQGTTFLLVEQNAQLALRIADYGYIMENGRIVFDGPADKLRGNQDVREFYLGLSEAGRRKSFKDVKFYKRRKRWAF
jgi:ABC-type branched-subunit amino acid transport system ATPase component